jgi:tRNA-2-methylthio-N6-dimethylallyladenosine synthase
MPKKKFLENCGELKNIKEQNDMIICFCGCMSQESHVIEKIKNSYQLVDVIFGTHNLYKFPELLYNKVTNQEPKRIVDVWDIDGEIYEGLPIKRESKTKASVIIMNGCNNFCSYCIVPYVRGRERSRNPEDILFEVTELAKDGCKEILLLGQNVNSYNPREGYNFANLLADLDKIDGIDIIRFMSPHPKDFKDGVIDVIAKSQKISKLIHLPLQSGSSKVLKAMNRGYTKEQYLDLANKIKAKIPDALFTTDIIVGFPGETEEDFEETLDVVKKMNYEQVFMFIYSVRHGTNAEKMEGHIPEEVKSERFNRLTELYDKMVEDSMDKYVGTTQKILIEGESKTNKDMLTRKDSY